MYLKYIQIKVNHTLPAVIKSEIGAVWGVVTGEKGGACQLLSKETIYATTAITMFSSVIQWSPDRGHDRDPEDRKALRRLKTRRNELTVSRSVSRPRSSMGFRPYATWN